MILKLFWGRKKFFQFLVLVKFAFGFLIFLAFSQFFATYKNVLFGRRSRQNPKIGKKNDENVKSKKKFFFEKKKKFFFFIFFFTTWSLFLRCNFFCNWPAHMPLTPLKKKRLFFFFFWVFCKKWKKMNFFQRQISPM